MTPVGSRRLRAEVRAELTRHGLVIGEDDQAERLRERLNDLYLDEVRRLRQRQRAGEIPLREYARHTQELKERFPLLGLPLADWTTDT
ncbi:MAG TPA: hypothetical protein VN083_06000 [Vicinamibacteria bacterium]|nr:hypothetical protein [Vicinamibacteria bacterium]